MKIIELKSSRWVRRLVVLLSVSLIIAGVMLLGSCDNLVGADNGEHGDDYEDGTFTVSLSGAEEKNGSGFAAVILPEGGGHPEHDMIAAGHVVITSDGTAEVIAMGEDKEPWTGTGGTTYEVIMLIQEEGGEPQPGDQFYREFPYTYTQDGDLSLSLTYSDDFGGALGVKLTAFDHTKLPAEAPEGDYTFSVWVYEAGTDEGDLEDPDYLLGTSGYKSINDSGEATVEVTTHAGNWEGGSSIWISSQGESYDVYYQIDGPDERIWWASAEKELSIDALQLVEYSFVGGDWEQW